MSVRVHQLAKEIGMENKDLVDLLRSRGYEVKSVSSTIDNISAESIVQEFAPTQEDTDTSDGEIENTREPQKAEKKTQATVPVFPEGVIVKSAEEIKRERQAAAQPKKPDIPKAASTSPSSAANSATTSNVPPNPLRTSQPPTPAPSSAAAPGASTPPVAPSANRTATSSTPPKPIPKAPPVTAAKVTTENKPDLTESADPDETSDDEKRTIHIKTPIVVRDFATEIEIKPFKLISELMEMGIFASMNQTIEESLAHKIANRRGFTLEIHHRGEPQGSKNTQKKKETKIADDDPRLLKPRPPVVCILGHVDHGKTTLLDTIRKANITENEAGGITQHIGAYQIVHNDHKITFLDTPGHAAFSKMRSRGANVTDISVLIVAADDGFKPQTEEALRFAQKANNSIVVAINKIDAKGANVDRVKQQMQEKGIAPEDWGGEVITVEISALKGTNISELLDMILLQAEVLELRANPDRSASGTIIEARIEEGRGATASVIIEQGTLKKGDALVCGEAYCKVKSMLNENNEVLKEAPPATPVKVIGWSEVPKSGYKFSTSKNEKSAKKAAAEATDKRKQAEGNSSNQPNQQESKKITVEDLFAAIAQQKKKCLNVIVKSDVQGATEALVNSLEMIESDKVDIRIISKGVGHISKSDVALASASEEEVTIVGFNVRIDNGVQSQAKHHGVRILQHNIIYELIDQVKEDMAELLEPEIREKKLGAAEVRQVFDISKYRKVAGCMVTQGSISRARKARLMRDGKLIHESKIDTLKRFKDDVKEVRAGFECGVNISGYDDYQENDVIECIEIEKIRPVL